MQAVGGEKPSAILPRYKACEPQLGSARQGWHDCYRGSQPLSDRTEYATQDRTCSRCYKPYQEPGVREVTGPSRDPRQLLC